MTTATPTPNPTTISLPQWKQDRQKKVLVGSATQMETAELCVRKWWLGSVRKLQVDSSTPQIFGTILHGVAERFAASDDLGRGPDGRPVDLFPEGWHIARNRFKPTEIEGEVEPIEQDQIKRLVAAALESGVLERRPGRQIEQQFRITILEDKCEACSGSGMSDDPADNPENPGACSVCAGHGEIVVQAMGFIDLAYPDQVEDHKTTSAMKWAKSPEALTKNIQMMTYAKVVLEKTRQQGAPPPKEITLRHNLFCKDPKDERVRKIEARVTPAQIDAFWATKIVPLVQRMVKYRRSASTWKDCPDPPNFNAACNAYGGCPYRSICNGMENEDQYQKRLDLWRQNADNDLNTTPNVGAETVSPPVPEALISNDTKGRTVMDFAARLAQKKALAGAAPGAATPASTPMFTAKPTVQVPATPAAPVAPTPASNPQPAQPGPVAGTAGAPGAASPVAGAAGRAGAPPWASAACTVPTCLGVGFNKEGKPCRICDALSKKAGKPTSDQFEIVIPGDGTAIWAAKDGSSQGESPLTATAPAPVKAEEKQQPVIQQPAAAPAAPAVTTTPTAPPAAPAASVVVEQPAKTIAQGRPGRPKKGFVLCINCAPIKGHGQPNSGRGVIHLTDVLKTVGENMAEAMKKSNPAVESFYDINAFDRRDGISKNGEAIAETFSTDIVVATGIGTGQSDLRALLDAIRPFAGMEIVGDAG